MFQDAYGDIAFGLMFIVAIGAAQCGFSLAQRMRARATNLEAFGSIQTAMFSILGLLLAFTFSLALSRFDARRIAVVNEATAISTAALRAEVLDAGERDALRADLKGYANVRIAFVRAASDRAAQQRLTADSLRRQDEIWAIAMRAARANDRPQMVSLLLQSLNAAWDAGTVETALADAHIPDGVIAVLFAIAGLTVGLAGFNSGLKGGRSTAFVLFALVLSLVTIAIVDMDRPQSGLIQVDLTPLQDVARSL